MVNETECRRRFLSRGGAALVVGLAGCVGRLQNGSDDAAKLVPDYGRDDHQLKRVAVSGETVVASTIPEPESSPESPGSAYVFEQSGGTWSQAAELTLPDDAPEDEFGDPVAIDGDTILVGAWYEETPNEWRSGTAYAFERSDSGEWEHRARLVPGADDSEGLPSGHVHAVAIDGATAVLGSPTSSDDIPKRAGSAFVYRRTDDGWQRQAELVPDAGDPETAYGSSVALAGDTALIGEKTSTAAAGENGGSAYVFERSNGEWTQGARLVAEDGSVHGSFGAAVALSEHTALVVADGDDDDGGSVSVFERAGDADWSQRTKLISEGKSGCIGNGVALEGDTALVGDACRSSAAVFVRPDGDWHRRDTLAASDGEGRTFGNSVSLSGETAVVSDWRQRVDGGYGVAYVFDV